MDPITLITIASMAAAVAKKSFETGQLLGQFVSDVKNIDQNVRRLLAEINALSTACEMVGSRIRGIAEASEAGQQPNPGGEKTDNGGSSSSGRGGAPLWGCVQSQIEDCLATVTLLRDAVEGVRKDRRNVFAQAWRQFSLNMKARDIDDARNRIRSHTASLQLVLQAITLELSYLGPRRADQQLFVLLENIRDVKQELGDLRGERERAVQDPVTGERCQQVAIDDDARRREEAAARERREQEVMDEQRARRRAFEREMAQQQEMNAERAQLQSMREEMTRQQQAMNEDRRQREMEDERKRQEAEEEEKRQQEATEEEKKHEQKRRELIQYTDKLVSSGETLYEESVAGGSVIGYDEGLDNKITSWVSRLQALKVEPTIMESEASSYQTDFRSGSSVEGADLATITDFTSDSGGDTLSRRDLDDAASDTVCEDPIQDISDEDDLQIEMIREAYELGRLDFQAKDYEKASMLLQEVLSMVEESPVRSTGFFDVGELRWMLAVCAYHQGDVQTAEAALKQMVQIPAQTQDERARLCEAGHILSLACVKLGNLHEARQYCDSALQGRRRLLGKHDRACHESLALLARIFELQDNRARAAIYSKMIPEDTRDEMCLQFKSLGLSSTGEAEGDATLEAEEEAFDEPPPLPDAPPPYSPPARPEIIRPPIPTKPPPDLPSQFEEEEAGVPIAGPAEQARASSYAGGFPMDRKLSRADEPAEGERKGFGSKRRLARKALPSLPSLPPVAANAPPTTLSRHQSTVSGKSAMVDSPSEERTAPLGSDASLEARRGQVEACLSALAKVQNDSGKKSYQSQTRLREFASAVEALGTDVPEAESRHQDVLTYAKDALEDSHPAVYKTYAGLGRLAEQRQDATRAKEMYQLALDGARKDPVKDGAFKSQVRSRLTDLLIGSNEPERARALLREELKSRRKLYGSRLRSMETAEVARKLREAKSLRRRPTLNDVTQ